MEYLISFKPGVLYTMSVGFSNVDVAGLAPEPKSQSNKIPGPEEPVFKKSTVSQSQAGAVLTKSMIGFFTLEPKLLASKKTPESHTKSKASATTNLM